MRITTAGLLLILTGDAALVIAVLAFAGILQLSPPAAVLLLIVGIAFNIFGVARMIRAAREPPL